jgi:hypothetical protein
LPDAGLLDFSILVSELAGKHRARRGLPTPSRKVLGF